MPSKKKKYSARFPPARIKKIMQTDEDVGKVAAAVPVVISRALELFIESLILKSADHTKARNAKTLSASHIKQIILSEKKFDFLKDLVANIPDVQANEDDLPECSTEQLPPKPRAKPTPVAPGQPPRPRGRPKKKRDEGETTSGTPVKRRHSEEERKNTESEGTDSDSEESDDEGNSGPPTDTLHVTPPLFYQEQPSVPGPSNPTSSATTFHTLLPAAMPVNTETSTTSSNSGTLNPSLESQNIPSQTGIVKYDLQNPTQPQPVTVAPVPSSSERVHFGSPPNLGVQTCNPQTMTTGVSSLPSRFPGSSAMLSTWGMPEHPLPKPVNIDPMMSDSYREAYQHISGTPDSSLKTSQQKGDSPVINAASSPDTATFLKERRFVGAMNRTSDMTLGLPVSSEIKQSVPGQVHNGENAASGHTKAMHPNQLHLDTKVGQGTFEKWSPTKAGVLDLSVHKKSKAEPKVKGDVVSGNAPLNLAQDLLKTDKDNQSHIASHGVSKTGVAGQSNDVKGTTLSSDGIPKTSEEKPPVGSASVPGYGPPMMGVPGYPVMPAFSAYGMMPPYNGHSQLGGLTPRMMPPYLTPSGVYLPYQGPLMGYPPTTLSDNTFAQQPTEKSTTKPS